MKYNIRILIVLSGILSLGVATAAGPAPDLRPVVGNPMNGKVGIVNKGTAVAGPSKLTILCKKVGGGSCAESGRMAPYIDPAFPNKVTVNFNALNPGASKSHILAFWNVLVWAPGKYVFSIKADAANVVAESNESNNKANSSLPVP